MPTPQLAKKAVKWLLAELPVKLFDRPLAPASETDLRHIAAFRARMSRCAASVEASPEVAAHWKESVRQFEKAAREKDPRGFLRWDESLSLRAGPGVFPQYLSLRRSPHWHTRWAKTLAEAPFGHPYPFFLHPKVGANIILHAYHLERIEQYTGLAIRDFATIVEFGGGYGGLCRLAHKVGFAGNYFIFDLPQQSVLQEFYLKGAGLPPAAPQQDAPGIHLYSDLEACADHLARVRTKGGPSLFIANWSLSETPVSLREKVNERIIDHCDHLLITYQQAFTGVDNCAYFEEWRNKRKGTFSFDVEKMPFRKPADYYMLGKHI